MALVPTSMVWAPALEAQMLFSKRRSRRFRLSRIGCPGWIRTAQKHLRLDLQRWNRISTPSLHVSAGSKQEQPLAPAAPTRQDLGICSDIVTAPQPLCLSGPMCLQRICGGPGSSSRSSWEDEELDRSGPAGRAIGHSRDMGPTCEHVADLVSCVL